MAQIEDVTYERFSGSLEEMAAIMLPLCRQLFTGFEDQYLLRRLPTVTDPRLWLARRAATVVGFKFGYQREPDLFYSWLGGVDVSSRKLGIASELMQRQHADLHESGYRYVQTRARAVNSAMIMLNLRHGFHIVGFELDEREVLVVWQRKALSA